MASSPSLGDQGQLGLGGGLEDPNVGVPMPSKSASSILRDESGDTSLTCLSAGASHTAAVTSSGRLVVCGSNDYGQLGHDGSQSRFVAVDGLKQYEVRGVSCGGRHTVAVDLWGKTFAWGADARGQCGHNAAAEACSVPRYVSFTYRVYFYMHLDSFKCHTARSAY